MSRRAFGLWGIELDDERFASALAALGILDGIKGVVWSGDIRSQLSAAVRDQMRDREHVSFVVGEAIGELTRMKPFSLSAAMLADAWKNIDRDPRPRIAVTLAKSLVLDPF